MPSIPLYGFDELEQSILNNAKRRVVGLMDVSQEQLTEKPETDPTNGKQDTFVEQLTDEVYNTIKDIEILDSYISDTSSIEELRLTTDRQPDTLRTLRPELKKGASQIASVNNALRKINATYDKLRPNMIYTDLKTFTGFVNSVSILKKSALRFFDIVDDLIDNVNKAKGNVYVRPVINKDEEPEIEEPPSVEIPSLGMDVATPLPEPVIAPQEPEPIPAPPPPPPPPRGSVLYKRRMKKYKELIDTLIQKNNIGNKDDKDNVLRYALEYERTNDMFLTEPEIQDYINANITNVPQGTPAPAPSTAPVAPNYTPQEETDFFNEVSQLLKQIKLSQEQKDELDLEINKLMVSTLPNLPTLDEAINVIDGIVDLPISQAPTQQASSSSATTPIEVLLDDADRAITREFLSKTAKGRIQKVVDALEDNIKNKEDTSAKEKELKGLLKLAQTPFITTNENSKDPEFKKKYPEFGKLYTDYKRERRNNNSNYSKYEDKLQEYIKKNKIDITMVDML